MEQGILFSITPLIHYATTPYPWRRDKGNYIKLSRYQELTNHWREIAWNGIRFKTPPEWAISQIGTRHLILEDEAGPVMEVKWGPVKGSFSHRSHLKRLSASQSRVNKGSIAEWFLPPPWEKALAEYETSGFVWQSKNTSGRGTILFCPDCRNATLIQFMGDSSPEREKILLAVLKSLQDHRPANGVLWAVFDIRLKLPAALRLSRYRFETGKYELLFTDGRQNVRFYRWAPAAAIMGGRDLIWFYGTIPEFAAGQPEMTTVDGCAAIEGHLAPAGDWRRAISRLRAKPSFLWFRLWHLEDKNRILGMRAESKRALDLKLLGQICSDYESL